MLRVGAVIRNDGRLLMGAMSNRVGAIEGIGNRGLGCAGRHSASLGSGFEGEYG